MFSSDLPDDLMLLAEACEQFELKLPTLYCWIHRGALRAWKRVGRLYVSRAELEDLYQPVQVAPHPETAGERRARQKRTQEILSRHGMRLNLN